jgi:hypothetical protein
MKNQSDDDRHEGEDNQTPNLYRNLNQRHSRLQWPEHLKQQTTLLHP